MVTWYIPSCSYHGNVALSTFLLLTTFLLQPAPAPVPVRKRKPPPKPKPPPPEEPVIPEPDMGEYDIFRSHETPEWAKGADSVPEELEQSELDGEQFWAFYDDPF